MLAMTSCEHESLRETRQSSRYKCMERNKCSHEAKLISVWTWTVIGEITRENAMQAWYLILVVHSAHSLELFCRILQQHLTFNTCYSIVRIIATRWFGRFYLGDLKLANHLFSESAEFLMLCLHLAHLCHKWFCRSWYFSISLFFPTTMFSVLACDSWESEVETLERKHKI